MTRKIQLIFTLLGMAFLSFACSGGEQVSGIFAEAQFSTVACQPKSKMISIRNDDTANPQRVQGVLFEMGTNEDRFFKIDKVKINDTEYSPNQGMVQDVIIPAGGIMSVQTTYNPKRVTTAGHPHVSYLDIFLNGPRLGIMQVRLVGDAETAAPGCGQGPAGTPHTFTVDKIKVTVKASSLPGGEFPYEVPAGEITKPFIFSDNAGVATTQKADFPNFKIKGSAIPGSGEIEVVLDADTTGTFDSSGKLIFDPTVFVAGGAIQVTGKFTTETSDATGPLGNLSLTGSALASNKMKLVFAAKLDNPLLTSLNGGVVGFEMEMTEQ